MNNIVKRFKELEEVYKVLFISLVISLLLTLLIILLPNSINNYYDNPEIYDTGFNYYTWKFRAFDVNNVARFTGWAFFALHLGTVFYLFKKLHEDMKISKNAIKKGKKKKAISKYNYYLLYANTFFIALHYLHTWVWYDALAQDTPVWSSQGSVIIMLVLILIMESPRRGIFFGKKFPFPKEVIQKVMKHHGAFITVAIIFTFWYHPMEFTWGHLFGFFYMYMLFIQMSMARTKVHNNIYWKVVLEVTVLFHGTFVAIDQANAPWAMFLFGFAFMFFVVQIYGLKLSKNQIHISQLVFLLVVLLVYSGLFTDYTIVDINEVIRIPAIDYILIFVFVYLIYLPIYLNRKFNIPNWVNKTVRYIFIGVLVLSGGMIIYSSSPYYAEPEMYDNISLSNDVTFEDTGKTLVYENAYYDTNIILIPGGKVDPEAYSYLAAGLANNGYKVTIIKPFLNLAILSPNQAENYFEEGKTNVIVGHSLGGVVGSLVTHNNEDKVDYLIMMGSYNIRPIDSAKTLSIIAEHDPMNTKAYNEATLQIENFKEVTLLGGNHAYFGYYGNQKGDGEATIPNLTQQLETIYIINQFLETY